MGAQLPPMSRGSSPGTGLAGSPGGLMRVRLSSRLGLRVRPASARVLPSPLGTSPGDPPRATSAATPRAVPLFRLASRGMDGSGTSSRATTPGTPMAGLWAAAGGALSAAAGSIAALMAPHLRASDAGASRGGTPPEAPGAARSWSGAAVTAWRGGHGAAPPAAEPRLRRRATESGLGRASSSRRARHVAPVCAVRRTSAPVPALQRTAAAPGPALSPGPARASPGGVRSGAALAEAVPGRGGLAWPEPTRRARAAHGRDTASERGVAGVGRPLAAWPSAPDPPSSWGWARASACTSSSGGSGSDGPDGSALELSGDELSGCEAAAQGPGPWPPERRSAPAAPAAGLPWAARPAAGGWHVAQQHAPLQPPMPPHAARSALGLAPPMPPPARRSEPGPAPAAPPGFPPSPALLPSSSPLAHAGLPLPVPPGCVGVALAAVEDAALGSLPGYPGPGLLLRLSCQPLAAPHARGPAASQPPPPPPPYATWLPYEVLRDTPGPSQAALRAFLHSPYWRQLSRTPTFLAFSRAFRNRLPHLEAIQEVASVASGALSGETD